MFGSKLGGFIVVFAIFRGVDRIIVEVCRKCGSQGSFLETRCIWRRLASELSKIKIRASFVTQIHRFGEPALGVKAVEDNAVNADGDNLDDNLDEGTNQ